MKRAVTVEVEIDLSQLRHYTEEHLAALWGVAQLNPAPIGDWAAVDTVRQLGDEIIRRFLARAGLPMYQHKADGYHWKQLTQFARYVPPSDTVPGDADRWHEGEWVPRKPTAAGPEQAIVDAAVQLIDAATSMPSDVNWRLDALRAAVEVLTFPDGKPGPPAAGGEVAAEQPPAGQGLPEGVQVNLGARRRVRPEGGQA